MAMGMSYSDYWFEHPKIAAFYRKSYLLEQQRQNNNAWLNGAYSYVAFATVLGNAFRKKGKQSIDYPEKPFDIFPKTEEQKRQEELEEYQKMDKALRAYAKNFKKGGVKNG